jgi:hypothetical protein
MDSGLLGASVIFHGFFPHHYVFLICTCNVKAGALKNTVYKKKDGIVTRTIAGETILVPVYGDIANMQKIFSVDPVAAFIWENIDGQKSNTDILNLIISEYDVENDIAKKDLIEFIDSLSTAGLISEI